MKWACWQPKSSIFWWKLPFSDLVPQLFAMWTERLVWYNGNWIQRSCNRPHILHAWFFVLQANISHHQLCKRLLYHSPSLSSLHSKQSRDIPLKLITFFATAAQKREGKRKDGREEGWFSVSAITLSSKEDEAGREGNKSGVGGREGAYIKQAYKFCQKSGIDGMGLVMEVGILSWIRLLKISEVWWDMRISMRSSWYVSFPKV